MGRITIIVLVIIVLVAAIYFIGQQRKQALQAQLALMKAQTEQQEACKKNWLCATQSLWHQADDSWAAFWDGSPIGFLSGGNE